MINEQKRLMQLAGICESSNDKQNASVNGHILKELETMIKNCTELFSDFEDSMKELEQYKLVRTSMMKFDKLLILAKGELSNISKKI